MTLSCPHCQRPIPDASVVKAAAARLTINVGLPTPPRQTKGDYHAQ